VLELLVEGGIGTCTFARVADRAGVERSTLYRRYEDRWMMIMDAVADEAAAHVSDSAGSFAKDLKAVLMMGAATMAGPFGAVVLALAAELRGTPRQFHIERYWRSRMDQLAPMFDAAIERGELPADVDREELFAFAMGTIHVRNFVAAKPVDEAWIDRIVEFVCDRYCVNRNAAADTGRGRRARGRGSRRSSP
jgi:AcrR family transcriptional regulator